MEVKNLWILTEERPKRHIIGKIFELTAKKLWISCFIDKIRILPILDKNWNFTSTYEIIWLKSPQIENIFLKIVSWNWSFVDYLVFLNNDEPKNTDIPLLAIEETKTDDSESRNTWIYQRATKFIFLDFIFKNTEKVMMYNFQVKQKENPTDTNIFWTKCLLTLWIKFIWKDSVNNIDTFKNIDELIKEKNEMSETKNW